MIQHSRMPARRTRWNGLGRLHWLPPILALGFIFGCQGALRDPTGLGRPDSTTATSGGGGGNGGGQQNSPLIGTWQAIFLFRLDNDVQRQTTTWEFHSDGTCRRTVDTFSVLADQTFRTVSDCSFRSGAFDVSVTYAGNSAAVTFQWSLQDFSSNKLILDGVVYDRIG